MNSFLFFIGLMVCLLFESQTNATCSFKHDGMHYKHHIKVGSDHPILLLVSFDGFRWDYLNYHNLSNFNKLKLMGSHADFIYNSFSTVTFPNHWTIVTGMYEESHGIVQNNIYELILIFLHFQLN